MPAIEQLEADLKWAAEQFNSPRYKNDYTLYRDYYDGNQDLTFATPKFTNTFGKLFSEFAYNRCDTVVDTISDHMKLLGMTANKLDGTEDENLKDQLALIWRKNRLDRLQGDIRVEKLKCGDGYLIIWPEKDEEGEYPGIYVNNADVVTIRYDDDTKKKICAVKAWKDDGGRYRINFYYPDFIYKYVTPEKKDELPKELSQLVPWVPDPLAVELGLAVPEPNPLPNPFRQVPVFHFSNNSRTGEYGRSVLRNVIPLQNALNKACTDLIVAMEYGAFPQRWAIGLQMGTPQLATGKVSNPFKEGPGNVWTANQGAQFGNFEVTPLEQFISVKSSFEQAIANAARIPGWYFDMFSDPPSGESMKTAGASFVSMIYGQQTDEGQDWEDSLTFALFTLVKSSDFNLVPNWKSAEIRSEADMLDAGLKKKQLGWSSKQIQRELGMDDSLIEQMATENADAMKEQQAQLSAGLGTGIPAGGGNTPPNRSGATVTNIRQRAAGASSGT